MPDSNLLRLIYLTLTLSLAHNIDHWLRGDFDPARNSDAYVSIGIVLAIYVVAGIGIYAYTKGRVGHRFWFWIGSAGLALTTLGHLNPYAEQSVIYIFKAYVSPLAGGVAVTVLFAMTAALLAATFRASKRAA